jgi:hypothetical protein
LQVLDAIFGATEGQKESNGKHLNNLADIIAKVYYKNAIKIDSAGIAVFASYEVPDLDLIEPENTNPNN